MFHKLRVKFEAWKLGRQKAYTKTLPDGSYIIKSNDLYFLAVDKDSTPVLINSVEGKRLWNSEG